MNTQTIQNTVQTLINQNALISCVVSALEERCDNSRDVALAQEIQALATLLDNHREKLETVTGSLELLFAQSFRSPHEHS